MEGKSWTVSVVYQSVSVVRRGGNQSLRCSSQTGPIIPRLQQKWPKSTYFFYYYCYY